jgi:hypothetical protein
VPTALGFCVTMRFCASVCFPPHMGRLMEKRFWLRVLTIPLELPAVRIYMIWRETRRKRNRTPLGVREVVMAELGRSPTDISTAQTQRDYNKALAHDA